MPATVHDLEVSDVKLRTLQHYKDNPRIGDTAAIAESLKTNGQFAPIVVNIGTHTGRPHEILKGNHTVRAAKSLKWPTIKAVHVDVDDEEAERIVLVDNKSSDLGGFDETLLANLLADRDDLTGTGYTPVDLDDMLSVARDAADEAAAAVEDAAPADPKPSTPTTPADDGNLADMDAPPTVNPMPRSHSIILSYPPDQYAWVTAKLSELGDLWDTASSGDTIIRLIETQEAATE